MAHKIRRIDYFNATVDDRPGEALRLLTGFADLGVNLVAFTTIPAGVMRTQLIIFPEDSYRLADHGERAGIALDGPHGAFLVQGEDVPGALVGIHEALLDAGIEVFASSGVSSGGGRFGYILHVRPSRLEDAARVLGV